MNMKILAAACCVAAVSCAAFALPARQFKVTMESDLAQAQNMSVKFEGKAECFGQVAKNAPVQCASVANVPRTVRVSWADPSRWGTSDRHRYSVMVNLDGQAIPNWFRSGDEMVIAINRQHRISIQFKCDRPGKACVSYPTFTRYGTR